MGALDVNEAGRLLNASTGTASYTAPTTPMKLALYSVTGSASATGTEVTGGSYARQSLTVTSAAGTGTSSNSAAVTFTSMPAVTSTAVEIFDSNATPRRALWGALTASKTTASGDSISFAISALALALS